MKTLRTMVRGVLVLALVLSMGLLGFGAGAAGNGKAFAQTEEGGFTLPEGVSADLGDVLAYLGIWTEVPGGGIAVAVLAPQISPVAEEQIVTEEGGGFTLPEGVSADLGDILAYLGIFPGASEAVFSPVPQEQIVAEAPQISTGVGETAPMAPADTSMLTGDLILDAEYDVVIPATETAMPMGDIGMYDYLGY